MLVSKMKVLIVLAICHVAISTVPSHISIYEEGVKADICTVDVCKAEDGCRCATSSSPLPSDGQAPQLISLTFDQPVTDDLFTNYWQSLLFSRKNPDDKSIGATFFVPHQYTDYDRVNDLYNHGFEIGVDSITHSNLGLYWSTAPEEVLEKEFGGQKHIISKFGNIPVDDIIGAYQAAGLHYDSSWPTASDTPLFPYTLDYLSSQQCVHAQRITCPNEAFRGFWVLPINDFRGIDDRDCTTLAACFYNGTADEIAEGLIDELNRIRSSTRVPITMMIQSYWFEFAENSFEGFTRFLDKIAEYKDVFLVSQKQVLEWTKDPVPLAKFKTESPTRNATCIPHTCELTHPNGYVTYMRTCTPCPASYPWLDNPDGL